jgi:hypothetical protein
MKRFRRLLIYFLLLAVVLAAIAFSAKQLQKSGALAPEVSIHGSVTRDGKPLQWKGERPQLWVIFQQRDVPGTLAETYPATCDTEAGTFSIAKIPLGWYKVSVEQMDPYPKRDLLNFAFNPANTTLEFEVTHDGQEFHIDLPKVLPRVNPPARPRAKRLEPDDDESK